MIKAAKAAAISEKYQVRQDVSKAIKVVEQAINLAAKRGEVSCTAEVGFADAINSMDPELMESSEYAELICTEVRKAGYTVKATVVRSPQILSTADSLLLRLAISWEDAHE